MRFSFLEVAYDEFLGIPNKVVCNLVQYCDIEKSESVNKISVLEIDVWDEVIAIYYTLGKIRNICQYEVEKYN